MPARARKQRAGSPAQLVVELLAVEWVLADGHDSQGLQLLAAHGLVASVADRADALQAFVGQHVQHVDGGLGAAVAAGLPAGAMAVGGLL